MTGDRNCEGIDGTGVGHCSHGPRGPDPAGHFRVGRCGPSRNFPQRLPDALLEGGAPEVEQQIERPRRSLNQADHLGDQLSEIRIAADELGPGEPLGQLPDDSFGLIAEENGADAAFTALPRTGAL
jgi:hypothetical protein